MCRQISSLDYSYSTRLLLWVSLSRTRTIIVCHCLGQLTPSAFVSTFHTTAFSHHGYKKEDKEELSPLLCVLNWQHNEADDQTLLSQLRLCIVNGKNEIKTSVILVDFLILNNSIRKWIKQFRYFGVICCVCQYLYSARRERHPW